MNSSYEIFDNIPNFKVLFKYLIVPKLSQRDLINARRSCQFFRNHINPEMLDIKGRVLPSLHHYKNIQRGKVTVRALIICSKTEHMCALTNKTLHKDAVEHYVPVDQFDKSFRGDPEIFSMTFRRPNIKFMFENIKIDYEFRNLLYILADVIYLVCDLNQRQTLVDMRRIVSEITSHFYDRIKPIVIFLAVNSAPLSHDAIHHTELEDFVESCKINNWFKVNTTDHCSVNEVILSGLKYVMRQRYPFVCENLKEKLLHPDVSQKSHRCTIC